MFISFFCFWSYVFSYGAFMMLLVFYCEFSTFCIVKLCLFNIVLYDAMM